MKNITTEQDKGRVKTLSVSCCTVTTSQNEEKSDDPTPHPSPEKSQNDKIGTISFIVSDLNLNLLAWQSLQRLFKADPSDYHHLIVDFERPGEFSCPTLDWKYIATDKFTQMMSFGEIDSELVKLNENRWSLAVHFRLPYVVIKQYAIDAYGTRRYYSPNKTAQVLTEQFLFHLVNYMEILSRNPQLIDPLREFENSNSRSITPPLNTLRKKFIVEPPPTPEIVPTTEPVLEQKTDSEIVQNDVVLGGQNDTTKVVNPTANISCLGDPTAKLGGQGVTVTIGCLGCNSDCIHTKPPTENNKNNSVIGSDSNASTPAPIPQLFDSETESKSDSDNESSSGKSDSEFELLNEVYQIGLIEGQQIQNDKHSECQKNQNDKDPNFKAKFMYYSPQDSHHNSSQSNCKHRRYHHHHINSHNMENSTIYRDSVHLQDCVVHLHLSEKRIGSARKVYKSTKLIKTC